MSEEKKATETGYDQTEVVKTQEIQTEAAETEDIQIEKTQSEETQAEETDSTADNANSEANAKTQPGEPAKKNFFAKKKDKRDEQIEELTDRVKRNMAEFDNFRKRTEKEKAAMYEIGAKDVVEKILPVVDNFERGLLSVPEAEQRSAFADGMDMIYKQLMKTLDDIGVKPIEAVGQPFDPNFHNAVMHVEDESLDENVVAEELQKGYMYRDSVIRHSMVKVAN